MHANSVSKIFILKMAPVIKLFLLFQTAELKMKEEFVFNVKMTLLEQLIKRDAFQNPPYKIVKPINGSPVETVMLVF